MRSTLARPGPARPITVLLVLLALDAGGAMAQAFTPGPSASSMTAQCCDPDDNSNYRTTYPTTIDCTDYPEGRVGRLWSGQLVCLSHMQGGYPKTAAGVLPALDRSGAKGILPPRPHPLPPPPPRPVALARLCACAPTLLAA